jgi:multidrug efflux pump subunit AcrB
LGWWVQRSFVVNLVMVAVLTFGFVTLLDLPRQLLPPMEFGRIQVIANLPGASAIEVERLVTFRLEESLQDVSGIDKIVSKTVNGTAAITLSFNPSSSDADTLTSAVRRRVAGLDQVLPRDLRPVQVSVVSFDEIPGPEIDVLGADPANPEHRLAIELLQQRLERLPQVLYAVSSLADQALHISFRESDVNRTGLDVPSARERIATFLRFQPIGQIRYQGVDMAIEVQQGFDGLEDLRALPLSVNRAGRGVTLEQVATVELRLDQDRLIRLLDGEPYVELAIMHAAEGDSIQISEWVRDVVEEVRQEMPEGLRLQIGADPSEFITHELDVLKANGLGGIAVVLVILALFLGLRISAMTALGLPFVYLGSLVLADAAGVSFNLISLLAMILVIGILVDDAIIVSESFTRHLQKGLAPAEAATEAATEMIRPVLGMAITTALAFMPLLVLNNELTVVLRPLPIIILSALALSVFESFLILPNHLQHFWPANKKPVQRGFMVVATRWYRRVLALCLKVRYLTVPAFVGLAVFTGMLAQDMKIESGISLSSALVLGVAVKGATTLEQTREGVRPIEAAIAALEPGLIDHTTIALGRRPTADGSGILEAANYAEIAIYPTGNMGEAQSVFKPMTEELEAALAPLRENGTYSLLTVGRRGGDDGNDTVTVFVSGSDRIPFLEIQDALRSVLVDVEGLDSVVGFEPDRMQTSWVFRLNQTEVLAYGLSPDSVAAQLRQRVPGPFLAQVRVRGQELEVHTHYEEQLQAEADALAEVTLLTPRGIAIPLRRLGVWERRETLRSIEHTDGLRAFQVDVRFDVDVLSASDAQERIEEALAPVRGQWPGFHISVEESESVQQAKTWLLKGTVLVIGSILLVLALSLQSLIEPILVALAIPFGLVGVVLALYLHDMPISVMAGIGALGLMGVVVNDSLVVLDTIRRLRLEGTRTIRESIIEGAGQRFQAVVLTSITTLGGVFPLAYGLLGEAGWFQPMVFALGWGLMFATVLTLVLLPSMLHIVEDFLAIRRWAWAKLKGLLVRKERVALNG